MPEKPVPPSPKPSDRGARHELNVTIDGQARMVSLHGLENFGDLMAKIEAEVIPSGRVVTSVSLNEEAISMEQEELLHGFGLTDVVSLALETAEPRILAIESLLHALDYLPQLAIGLESAAANVRAGKLELALGRLDASLDLLQHFLAMLEGVRAVLRIDFSKVILEPDEGGSFLNLQNRLGAQVEDLFDAAEQEDWSMAGEIAAYEIAPLIYRFLAAMPLLLEVVSPMVPEYRAQLLSRAQASRAGLMEDLWQEDEIEIDDDEDDDDDEDESDDDVLAVKPKGGNGHSEPDRITERLIDDLDDEWDPKHPEPGSGPPN